MGRRLVPVVLALGLAPWAGGGTFEVQVELPQAARIDLAASGYQSVSVAGFIPGEGSDAGDYAYEREAARFLERLFVRETSLKVVETTGAPLPFRTIEALVDDTGFWKTKAAELGVDLILTGQVKFKKSNRSGYERNVYTSAVTGRTYENRPTFVYRSGVTLGLEVVLIEGRTGEVLYRDRFLRDRTLEGGGGDPLQGFFDLMRGMTPAVLGIVSPQKAVATRYLLD